MTQCAPHLKLTHHCKSTVLQRKCKRKKEEREGDTVTCKESAHSK